MPHPHHTPESIIAYERKRIALAHTRIKAARDSMRTAYQDAIRDAGGYTLDTALTAYLPHGENTEGKEWLRSYMRQHDDGDMVLSSGYNTHTNQWGMKIIPKRHAGLGRKATQRAIMDITPHLTCTKAPHVTDTVHAIQWSHQGHTDTARSIILVEGTDLSGEDYWVLAQGDRSWAIINLHLFRGQMLSPLCKGTLDACLDTIYTHDYFVGDDDDDNDDNLHTC